MSFRVKVDGVSALEKKLDQLNSIRWQAIVKKNVVEMINRARQPGGTPVDTGELRAGVSGVDDEMGYIASYAPHVEYGHRVVVNGDTVGYVEGQHFLQDNFTIQRKIYLEDLKNALEKEEG